MLRGRIVFFRSELGYGYLRLPATREEFFFRASENHTEFSPGDWVTFRLVQDRSGVRAKEVKRLAIA